MAKILVVDDSPIDRQLVVDALKDHTVQEATDGEEAIEKAKSFKPDIVILDVVMPKKNGFEVAREIRRDEATSGTAIVLLTSKDQESDKMWGAKQGANHYLVKPFTDAELLKVISPYT